MAPKWIRGMAGLIALSGAICLCAVQKQKETSINDIQPGQQSAMKMRISALGTLEPSNRLRVISSPIQGSRLGTLLVKEGQDVAEGALLAQLDIYGVRKAELNKALSDVEVAQARLFQVKAGAKPDELRALDAACLAARQNLEQRQRDLQRYENLAASKTVSTAEAEERRLAVSAAREALRESEARRAALGEVRDVDLKLRETEIELAKRTAAVAEESLQQCCIKAPCSGRILRIHARPGEYVGERGLLEMGDVSTMCAVTEVYEADIKRVIPGMSAQARLKSSDIMLSGKVVEIGHIVGRKVALDNDPVSDTDARVVEVRIALTSESSRIVAGLANARVEVMIGDER